MKKQATELEFLRWYYENADFGPAHEDCVDILKEEFEVETGKKLPKRYAKD